MRQQIPIDFDHIHSLKVDRSNGRIKSAPAITKWRSDAHAQQDQGQIYDCGRAIGALLFVAIAAATWLWHRSVPMV